MHSCKEVRKILSSGEKLGPLEKMKIKLHLSLCKQCSNYEKQIQLISDGFKKLFHLKMKINSQKIKELEDKFLEKLKK